MSQRTEIYQASPCVVHITQDTQQEALTADEWHPCRSETWLTTLKETHMYFYWSVWSTSEGLIWNESIISQTCISYRALLPIKLTLHVSAVAPSLLPRQTCRLCTLTSHTGNERVSALITPTVPTHLHKNVIIRDDSQLREWPFEIEII